MAQSPSSHARFRAVFDEHHDAVHLYCLRRLSPDEANEATAEVFLVAWRRLERLPSGPDAVRWLIGVARNVVRNKQRNLQRRGRLVQRLGAIRDVRPDEPLSQVIRHESEREVHEALSRLRPREQELLLLKAWDGMSNEQVAEILGITYKAVEGRYTRALKKLSKGLGPGRSTSTSPRLAQEGGEQ